MPWNDAWSFGKLSEIVLESEEDHISVLILWNVQYSESLSINLMWAERAIPPEMQTDDHTLREDLSSLANEVLSYPRDQPLCLLEPS